MIPQYLVSVNRNIHYIEIQNFFKNFLRGCKKIKAVPYLLYEGRTPHLNLDKRRKPKLCPGSHTGAVDSVHLRAHSRISAQRGLKYAV